MDAKTIASIELSAMRRLFERRQVRTMWAQNHWITPQVVSEVFGDGMKVMELFPIMFRPNHFVVRVDSKIDTCADYEDWLDPIYDSIEEEFYEWPWAKAYGLTWHEDEEADCDSRLSFSDGSSWHTYNMPVAFFHEVESLKMLRGLWRESQELQSRMPREER